jgi:hypothetical protein
MEDDPRLIKPEHAALRRKIEGTVSGLSNLGL